MSAVPWVWVRVLGLSGDVLFESRCPVTVLQEALRIASSLVDNYVRASAHDDPPLRIEVSRLA